MPRTLSDNVIVAMIEAATRLAGGRGPIAGSSAPGAPAGAAPQPATIGQGAQAALGALDAQGVPAGTAVAAPAAAPAAGASAGPSAAGGERDARTAAQIAADFRTIFTQIEEAVRAAADQETKAVGFAVR